MPSLASCTLPDMRETKMSQAALLLEKAERLATSDPAAALPALQKALRACRRAGVQWLETRGFAALGATLAVLGRLDHSEAAFSVANRSCCPCCQPVVDRLAAYLLDLQGKKQEAVASATRAVKGATGPQKGRALVTLGTVRLSASDVSGAVEDLTQALDLLPVGSPQHSVALANLGHALKESAKLEDVQRAVEILLELPERFKGLKYLTVERTTLSWSTGQALALLVRLSPEMAPQEMRDTLLEAHRLLSAAVAGLEKLGLLLDLAAARTDLANVQAMLDPFEVLDTLAGIPAKGTQSAKAFDLSKAKEAAIEAAAGVFSSDRIRLIWEALRALRDATVEAGAPRPFMVYEAP